VTNSSLQNDRSGACGGTHDYRLAFAEDKLHGISATAPELLGQQLPAVAAWLGGAYSTPAELNANPVAADAEAANTLINQVCADYNTPITFHSGSDGG
jgi:hypothetical protein